MRKIYLFLFLIILSTASFAQNTSSLPYWSILTKTSSISSSDSISYYNSGVWKKSSIARLGTPSKLDTSLASGKIWIGQSYGGVAAKTPSLNASAGSFSLSNAGVVTFPDASGSGRGFLNSTDWTTFNNKQATLVSGTNIKTVNGSSLLGSGDLSTTQTITLTGDVTGSGTGSFATTIGSGKVTNSMLAGSIDYSKLSLTGSILNTDLAGSIADGKLSSSYLYADGSRALTGAWYNSQNASFSMLGAGTGSTPPSATLHIVETGTTTPRGVIHDQYNSGTNSSQFNLRKARNTFASPQTIVTGDILSNINSWGHDGTAFLNMAAIRTTSVGTIGTNRVPTKMEFMTATDASPSVLTTALTLDQTQLATFANGITLTSGVITAPVGSNSAPSLNFGSSNTGIYGNGGTGVLFTTNGTLRVTLSSSLTFASGFHMAFNTGATGTQMGTASNQKMSFWGATTIVQPVNTTAINDVLVNTGLMASGANSAKFSVPISQPFAAKTTTYTITFSDATVTGDATSAAFTITLPSAATVSGVEFTIKKIDASGNAVTVGTTSSQTIDGSTTYTLSARWSTITVQSDGSNWIIVSKI